MNCYVQVYNSAMKETVAFDKMKFESFGDAKTYREQLRNEYQQGCHEVRLFIELFPEENEEDDIEEEFDELEEEE